MGKNYEKPLTCLRRLSVKGTDSSVLEALLLEVLDSPLNIEKTEWPECAEYADANEAREAQLFHLRRAKPVLSSRWSSSLKSIVGWIMAGKQVWKTFTNAGSNSGPPMLSRRPFQQIIITFKNSKIFPHQRNIFYLLSAECLLKWRAGEKQLRLGLWFIQLDDDGSRK